MKVKKKTRIFRMTIKKHFPKVKYFKRNVALNLNVTCAF